MENLERCLKIKARLKEFTAGAAALEKEIWQKEKECDQAVSSRAQEKLPPNARRTVVNALLDGKTADPAHVTEGEKIKAIRKDLEEQRAAISLLKEERAGLRGAVVAEIREKFFAPYSMAIRTLNKKVDEAAAAEKEIIKIWTETQALFTRAGFPAFSALPNFTRICFEDDGIKEPSHPIRLFRKEAKQEGIDLG